MRSQTKEKTMTYELTPEFRVDFTAYAPMHTFKGWTLEGVTGCIEMDPGTGTVLNAHATARTRFFNTNDEERNRAMADYIQPDSWPEARIDMTVCKKVVELGNSRFRADVLAVLEFMGVRRQLPVTLTAALSTTGVDVELSLKWSFRAYGLKAPRLLFLTVRDIVNIRGRGKFQPVFN